MRRRSITKDKLRESVKSSLFPRRCPFCDEIIAKSGRYVCERCERKAEWMDGPRCLCCGRQLLQEQGVCERCLQTSFAFRQNVSLWKYAGSVRTSLSAFKYKNKREYADYYAREALRSFGALWEYLGIEAIIPIPLHKSRKRRRGYNQAACIATILGRELHLPVYENWLCRRRKTAPLKTLSAAERLKALQDVFVIKGKPRKKGLQWGGIGICPVPDCVLLVDDIFTTGSTLHEASITLLEAGVQKVYTFTVAIG